MMNIEEIILKLIQEQKKVFLKNIGQLTVEKSSATIHPVTHEITPPCSILVFSRSTAGDEKLLINQIAKEYNISIEQADDKANQYLKIIQNTFNNTGVFTIDNLCTVEKKMDDSFVVQLLNQVIIDKNDIGLKQVKTEVVIPKTVKIQEQVIQEQVIKETQKENIKMENQNTPKNIPAENKNPQSEPEQKKKGKGVWLIIVLLLLVAAGVVGYIFKDDLMKIFVAEKSVKPAETTSPAVTDSTSTQTTNEAIVDTTTKKEAVAEVAPEVKEKVAPVETVKNTNSNVTVSEKPDLSNIVFAPKNAGKFYVIAMSFKDLGNASKGVKKLKKQGYNPIVIEKNEQGLIRVAYKPGYETERLARDFADELYEKKNLDPWIVKY
jgi:hypothetical protein